LELEKKKKVQFEKMSPPNQVAMLLSTLETGGNIVPLARGLQNRFKNHIEFTATKGHEAFNNEKLLDLVLNGLRMAEHSTLASFLVIVRRIAWIG
jgi:hypothetical protein